MRINIRHKYPRFWIAYFCVRIFYLLFDVFVYGRISTLGDTARYLSGGSAFQNGGLSLFNSTSVMDIIGLILGRISLGNELIANLPFTLMSFCCVYWTITKTEMYRYINKIVLFVLISLPNFCIWTSILSKESVGLIFSAIFSVLFINFLNKKFKIRLRDYFAAYLCIVFKPQYFPFIFGSLLFIYLCSKLRTPEAKGLLSIFITILAIAVLWIAQPLIDVLALQMYAHFDFAGTSTRPNIFVNEGDFMHYAPYGMLQSFVGPTFSEMIGSPLNFIAGLEGWGIVLIFIWLASRGIIRVVKFGKLSPVPLYSISFTVLGILFVHYPFGIFNAGSAIRYRTNFLFLFIILFSYLYAYYKPSKKPMYSVL